MLWCTVHGIAPRCLCRFAWKKDGANKSCVLVGEHRMERWSIRCGPTDEDQLHACDDPRNSERLTGASFDGVGSDFRREYSRVVSGCSGRGAATAEHLV